MVCPNCGREHQNAKGQCPFCHVPHRMAKRYKRDAAEREIAAERSRLIEEVERNLRTAKQERQG